MNWRQLRQVPLALAMGVLLSAGHCDPDLFGPNGPGGGDDDDGGGGDDDDLFSGGLTVIEGEVIAIDRATNVVLTDEQYSNRAGGLVLYVLPDASNLSEVFAKVTMSDPGPYSVEVLGYTGPIDVMVIADQDSNLFIDSDDTAREHAFNPIQATGNRIIDVDVYIDLPGSLSTNDPDEPIFEPALPADDDDSAMDEDETVADGCVATQMSGVVVINGFPEGDVAVTTNSADLTTGPREVTFRGGSGPFTIAECNSQEETSLLAYLDGDNNGYFEPSDPIGVGPNNPYILGIGDIEGIQIDIPSLGDVTVPSPPLYVPLSGTVTYNAFTVGDIIVQATHASATGMLYSSVTLAAPGAFSLIAPSNTDEVLVYAVLDIEGDGYFDITTDPWTSIGPFTTGTGITGLDLDLDEQSDMGSVEGWVAFGDTTGIDDLLFVDLVTELGPNGEPVGGVSISVEEPVFPVFYRFDDVPSDTYWVGAFLDVNGDNLKVPPGPEDAYSNVGPVLLSPGGNAVMPTLQLEAIGSR